MIVDGNVVGVSSSITVEAKGMGRTGNYTNINYAPNKAFLKYVIEAENLDIRFP